MSDVRLRLVVAGALFLGAVAAMELVERAVREQEHFESLNAGRYELVEALTDHAAALDELERRVLGLERRRVVPEA